MAGIKTRKPYHSVMIAAPPSACAAALALGGKRILSTEAPRRLPLAECDRPDGCRCVYKHFKDRRAGPRREAEHGKLPSGLPRQRRQGRGRRESD